MPLEELLAMYGYEAGPDARKGRQQGDVSNADQNEMIPSTSDQSLDAASSSREYSADGWQCAPNLNMSGEESDSDDEDYDDYEDSAEEWRRPINIGEEYQAVVPDGLCQYDDVPAYENEDKILWDPSRLPDHKVEEFLKNVKQTTNEVDATVQPDDQLVKEEIGPIGDDEQALYLLIQCDHQPDEALRRRKMQATKSALFEQITPFSEEECTSFEEGLALHGKDFHAIQRNKVIYYFI